MICSYISNTTFGIVKLHSEQVYTYISEAASNPLFILNKSETGYDEHSVLNPALYTNKLTISTIFKLLHYIKKLKLFPQYFILDFDRLFTIQKNLRKSIEDLELLLTKKGSKLLITNFNIELTDGEENLDYFKNFNLLNSQNTSQLLDGLNFDEFITLITKLIDERSEERLIQCFSIQDPPFLHESSSVYLTRYFDFKKFIAKDSYVYFCLYNLALKMIEKNENHLWEINPNSKTILFCQTLSGAFISSILSDLLGMEMFVVDHLGPINKVYSNKLFSKIDESSNYIVVSDVLCLGTEVKNAKSIIEFSGAKYLGNVAFLRIESRYEKDVDFKDIEYLYRISETYNPVQYSIITALKQ
jgi:hypothetical protein